MATERLLPAFVDETHCKYKSVDSGHPLSTAFGCDENAETYARFYMVNGGATSTKVLYGFDLSAIPDNAEIGSVSAKIKGRMQNDSIFAAETILWPFAKTTRMLSDQRVRRFSGRPHLWRNCRQRILRASA